MNEQPIVELKDVSFTYGCHPVLEKVNLNIYPGDAVVITGPNGAGKTTLLKLVLGQLKASAGSIKIFGQDVSQLKDRYRLGYVAQRATHFNSQFPATVREVVASGRVSRRGLFRPLLAQDYHLVDETLELVGLTDFRQQPVGALSGGQQQRVFIARALVSQPDLLILDEPTTGIDAMAQASLYQLLRQLNQERHITMLIVSHELAGLASVVTRQVCLDKHICTCRCHAYPSLEAQLSHCSRRTAWQYAK
ncbi:metal ABC transporter ATP-binding protein [Desulfotomaculum nigrificans]|uniref:metal ABC transporter ATP-binding protein n=1 Tax=Desulfotomaculum nigrificans TaxID=1565 RepID=UPI0001FAE02C|nr:metal ABC transporter ATP-binding protein [Desulfotomaculum nigrificans]